MDVVKSFALASLAHSTYSQAARDAAELLAKMYGDALSSLQRQFQPAP